MNDPNEQSLEERVEKLERTVLNLQQRLARSESSPAPQAPAPRPSGPAPRPASPPPPFVARRAKKKLQLPDVMRQSEYWLNKIGIGLLLFGVAFLFKYSVDEGWITPAVRVAIGLAIGAALTVIGLRTHGSRRHFSQVLMGGSIAVFYICGFAAFQLYALVSHPVAMGFMVLVTVAAFVLALRQNEAVLSLIGTAGGLGTPFLLYTGAGSLPGLVIYTCVLLAGASAVYFYRGWRSLLWVNSVGGWVVFLTALSAGIADGPTAATSDRLALQLGVAFGWLAFGVLPTIREAASAAHERVLDQGGNKLLARHVHLAAVSTPLIVLATSQAIWSHPSGQVLGWVAAAGCGVYALAARILQRWQEVRDLARTHALVAVMLLTVALCLLLEGDTLLFSLAAEATVLHFVARRLTDVAIRVFAHLQFGALAVWLTVRVLDTGGSTGILTAPALTDLWVIATALLVARISAGPGRIIYLLAAHLLAAGWLVRELDGNVLFVALVAEAAILRVLAHRLKEQAVDVAANLFFGALAVWLAQRLFVDIGMGTPFLNGQAVADGCLMAAALGASMLVTSTEERYAYRLGAHLAILAWMLRELATLSSGQAYVTIAWGAYAVILLVAGLRLNRNALSAVALGTLLLVVGKLFFVDLVKLEAIWRILLFLGFGGGFLVISFYFQSLWKSKAASNGSDEATDRAHSEPEG